MTVNNERFTDLRALTGDGVQGVLLDINVKGSHSSQPIVKPIVKINHSFDRSETKLRQIMFALFYTCRGARQHFVII